MVLINNSERIMLCLIHIQPRLPFLVCGRLLPFKQTKTPCLAVFDTQEVSGFTPTKRWDLIVFSNSTRRGFHPRLAEGHNKT